MTYHFALNQMAEAEALVLRHHYSKRTPSNVQLVGTLHEGGGLFGDTGPAVAACFFAIPPTRWSEPVLELVRLVRRDDVKVQLTSLIAETCRWLLRKRLADLAVSFADRTFGHHGGIYQAASWNYDGCRKMAIDGVLIGGVFVPGRTANSNYGTRSPAKLAAQGIVAEPHYDAGKHLYWRALNRSGAKKAQRLGLEQKPYPKPTQQSAEGVA